MFEWPASFPHRRPLKRVSPRTAEKNLLDLQTALRELLIAGGPEGEALLDQEPFVKAVNFGETEAEARHAYTLDRFAAVLTVSDDATEFMRTEGLAVTENRSTGRRDTVKKLERIVPGILRMALHHQFSHPTRPASWQAVSISDVALDSDGVASLINSLRPKRHEPRFTVDAADVWVHGAIVYRRPFSKLKTERIVPLSPVFAAVVREYLEGRDRYLSDLGVESDALYPSPRDPSRHISDTDMRLLLKKGDEVARRRLAEAGGNPDRVIPLLAGTEWYGYRRLWKTEINGLGWEGESASLYVGDWKPSEKAIADRVYAGLKPRTLLAIVERISLPAAIARNEERPDRRDISNPQPVDFAKLAAR